MLLNFRFENFKSFEPLTQFSMITGRAKKHPTNYISREKYNVLKFSAIYGPNAGGKSNFVDAIGLSQAIILNDVEKVITKDRFNKNNVENRKKPTNFEYEISVENRVYSYGFSINFDKKIIYKEWLFDITDEENDIKIFTRDYEGNENKIEVNYKFLELDKRTINRINVYKEDMLNNTISLFLNTLNTNKLAIKKSNESRSVIEKVFNWFYETLEVVSPDEATKSYSLTYLDDEYLKMLGTYLTSFDTGVREARFEKTTEDALGLPINMREKIYDKLSFSSQNNLEDKRNSNKDETVAKGALIKTNKSIFKIEVNNEDIDIYEIRFVHSSKDVTYSWEEESDGTKRIIDIFSILLENENKVYIVDELDRSLHPNLTYNFIKRFLSKENENQLIVTTHEDRLLDLNLLRRDQIWFVERNEKDNSHIYSLEDFKERFDKNILKQYLDGRYGSVPKFDFIFEELD